MGLQLLCPVGLMIGYGYHLQGRGKTIPLHLALEIRWSVKVTGEQHDARFSHCFTVIQRDFVGWGLSDLKGLFCLGPASVRGMYKSMGKSSVVSLGPSYLVAPFCILLRRLKCGPFQDLLNRICL